MIQPSIYRVEADLPGRLYLMPKPSTIWLADDLGALCEMGITYLVSLLCDDELADLGLEAEAQICSRIGMTFTRLPVADRGIPERRSFTALASSLAEDVRQGGSVAVHCRGGIGRAGMLSACVLQHFNISPHDAVELVRSARGVDVPDTNEQMAFILNYSAPA